MGKEAPKKMMKKMMEKQNKTSTPKEKGNDKGKRTADKTPEKGTGKNPKSRAPLMRKASQGSDTNHSRNKDHNKDAKPSKHETAKPQPGEGEKSCEECKTKEKRIKDLKTDKDNLENILQRNIDEKTKAGQEADKKSQKQKTQGKQE